MRVCSGLCSHPFLPMVFVGQLEGLCVNYDGFGRNELGLILKVMFLP